MSKVKRTGATNQLIVNALMTGKSFSTNDLLSILKEKTGQEFTSTFISNLLYKLSNKSDLSYFIKKKKKGRKYLYSLAKEILQLSEEQVFGLTRKIGKNRFTLQQALEEIPEIEKYVEKENKEKPAKQDAEKTDKPATKAESAEKPGRKVKSAEKTAKTKPEKTAMPADELADLVNKFTIRPKKYAGTEFTAWIMFTEEPRAALDHEATCLRLEIGDTIRIHGTLSEIDVTGTFFVSGDVADRLDVIDLGKKYLVTARMIFGVHVNVHYTDDIQQIVTSESEKGYQILDVE